MRSASIGSPAASRQPPSTECTPCSGEAGFTLLETLTALAILAIALVSLYDAQSRGVRAADAVASHAEARIIAQSLLTEAQSPRGQAPVARRGKQGRYRWTVEVAPEQSAWAQVASSNDAGAETQAPSNSDHEAMRRVAWQMYRVRVSVGWDHNRNIVLESLKLAPARK